MYFITTKRMLEVCFFQHTPTFIIEPEKISGSHQSRNQKRNIYDHEEYDDQSDQVRDNRFGDPLDRKSRDTGSNEQVDAHWRGNHAHCQVTGHEDTKVNRINAQCICDWEHNRGQDHDVRDVINDHTTDDHDQVH